MSVIKEFNTGAGCKAKIYSTHQLTASNVLDDGIVMFYTEKDQVEISFNTVEKLIYLGFVSEYSETNGDYVQFVYSFNENSIEEVRYLVEASRGEMANLDDIIEFIGSLSQPERQILVNGTNVTKLDLLMLSTVSKEIKTVDVKISNETLTFEIKISKE